MRALPPGLLSPAPSSIATTPGLCPRLAHDGGDLKESTPAILDPQLSASQTVRVPALFAVRDAARAALRAQLDGATPQVIQESQRRLNAVYDQFVFRYGPLNAHANVAAMGINPDAFFLRALERWDTESQQRHKTGRPVTEASARQRLKMPLFHEIVVRQARPARSARSVRDAYLITLNECGGLNFGRMASLLGPGSSPDDVRDALAADGLIFEDPEAGWQTADAYLSGNVKRKLATAQRAMVAEPRFQHNVDALQLVIPVDIAPGQIEVASAPTGFRRLTSTGSWPWSLTPKSRAGHATEVSSSTTLAYLDRGPRTPFSYLASMSSKDTETTFAGRRARLSRCSCSA